MKTCDTMKKCDATKKKNHGATKKKHDATKKKYVATKNKYAIMVNWSSLINAPNNQILSLQRFASRQDQTNPETWLGSRCPCPTCRLIFVGHSSMKFDFGSALVDKYKSESCFTFSNPLPLSETQFTPLFCSINHILKVLK